MAGRPTVRTAANAAIIEQAIAAGGTYRMAAQAAGMSDDTLADWRKADSGFSERLTRAEAEAGLRWLALIDKAAQEDWRAAAWKLERRFHAEFGRLERREHTGKDGGPIQYEAADILTAEERAALRAALTGHEGGRGSNGRVGVGAR